MSAPDSGPPDPCVEFVIGPDWATTPAGRAVPFATTQAYAVCPCGQRVWLGPPVNPCPVCGRAYDRWGCFLPPVARLPFDE
jgi:hypothetical protein